MPSGPRIWTNNVFGTVSDDPLTNVATTLNSAGLANLAAVSSAFAVIVLDPERTAGAPEIVFVTAHTGAATSATIVRARYGTSARQHDQGTPWVHAATKEDLIQILTSSTRPSDPYEGDLIYETDTDRFSGYDGTNWKTIAQLGAWTSYTPTNANVTVGNGTQVASSVRLGNVVLWKYTLTFGSTTAFTGTVQIGLPVSQSTATLGAIGAGWAFDTSTAANSRTLNVLRSGAQAGQPNADGGTAINATVPFTWATGDVLSLFGTFEAA